MLETQKEIAKEMIGDCGSMFDELNEILRDDFENSSDLERARDHISDALAHFEAFVGEEPNAYSGCWRCEACPHLNRTAHGFEVTCVTKNCPNEYRIFDRRIYKAVEKWNTANSRTARHTITIEEENNDV